MLFVGYDHNDIVMNYLARALPESRGHTRFALTGETHDLQHWRVLGIEPIIFPQATADDYSALNRGIVRMAEIFTRGVLDWQREIVNLARKRPFLLDDEAIDLVGEVLADDVKTRLFTEAEPSAEWIAWLDKHKYLDGLFRNAGLSTSDTIISKWLAERFAVSEADELFRVIAEHDTALHPDFWWDLGRRIGSTENRDKNADILRKWAVLLAATAPAKTDCFVLSSIGARCAEQGLTDGVLLIFDALAKSVFRLELSNPWPDDGARGQSVDDDLQPVANTHELETLSEAIRGMAKTHGWTVLAEPLLRIATRRLEERYRQRCAWRAQNRREWDPDSGHRSAIEPHCQNARPKAIDVLVDTARDCLEWLAGNDSRSAERWCDALLTSNTPLLSRLAVHTVAQRLDLTPDERIGWVLENTGLHHSPAHHEIFRTAGLAYPDAGPECRARLVESVRAYRPPRDNAVYSERITVRWLQWLCKADPDCEFAKSALQEIQPEDSGARAGRSPGIPELDGSRIPGAREPVER